MRRRTLAVLPVLLLLAACGAAPPTGAAPWAAAHPDPQGMHFADPQGVCRLTVRYPDDAPGEIDYAGKAYIQRSRNDSRSASGQQVGTSADWTVYKTGADELLLVTATAAFDYRSGSKCGSDVAPPT